MPNTAQISIIYTLLNKFGLKDQKESIVSGFTGGRSESVRDMSSSEAAALIGHLKSLDPIEGKADRMRKKILAMAHEMKWHIPDTTHISMARVNDWMKKRSYLHKKLDAYTYVELPKLVSQFEQVYKSYLRGVSGEW